MKKRIKSALNDVSRLEWNLLASVIFLCCFGSIMIYSISGSLSELGKHLKFMAFGFVFIIVFQYMNYHILAKLVFLIYGVGITSILGLLTPLGVERNGATRWLNIGGFQFQVAEAVKVAVIIMLAWFVWHYYGVQKKIMLTLYLWALGGIPAILLLKISNDLSSSLVILGITFMTTLTCLDTLKLHFIIFLCVGIVAGVYIWSIYIDMPSPTEIDKLPFREQRIAAWINPEMYADNQGYQTLQALYAIGSGGFTGKGLGKSVQKYDRLPEAHNDMVLAIVAEELGVFGILIIVILMLMILYLVFLVAAGSEKSIFGRVLAVGIFFHFAIQGIINMAVVCGVFPNTGLPFPFISSGGTSLLCCMAEIGIVVSIERRSVILRVKKQILEEG